MRILIISQMWPSQRDPDFGAFLVPHVAALRGLGHQVEVVAIDHRGGSALKYAGLTGRAVTAAARFKPDVVLAHMLFPAGGAATTAARVARAPLVVMAHGQDVANLERPAVKRITKRVIDRADGIVTNSDWLSQRLRKHFPGVETTSISLGVDIETFSSSVAEPVSWPGDQPRLLCVGSLTERKNVLGLADAFAELGRGSLVFVGDGELRPDLTGRENVTVTGRLPQSRARDWMAACDVLCQPSREEPFGLAALEAMALEKTVLASMVGGPSEFVPADAGVLVDPGDQLSLVEGMRRAIEIGSPNPAARAAAEERSAAREAERFVELLEAARR
jgi:glycosyltransferase involved in cell wall biosynthesis